VGIKPETRSLNLKKLNLNEYYPIPGISCVISGGKCENPK
jgi:hypothetical protein